MSILSYIIIFTFLGSVASLIGGIILVFKDKLVLKISHLLISFAAGTLLGTAFFDLLPEALEEANEINIFSWTLAGLLFFFLLERCFHSFHHHTKQPEDKNIKSTVPLIIVGDTVHNFLDGIAIAASFLVSIPLGIVTALAIMAHEIPQEIGDFAILLHRKVPKKKVVMINVVSASVSLLGALLTFYLKDVVSGLLPVLLSITAGFFIYIASSDLIPEIHHEKREGYIFYETSLLFVGVIIIWLLVSFLE